MKLFPRVIPLDKIISFTLNLKNPNNIKNIESINIFSKNDYFHNEKIKFEVKKQDIVFEYKMETYGEYILKVNFNYKESKTINIFAVEKDILALSALKGDLHMHTTYSDGKRTPIAMVLESLEFGMDFISITDHDNYTGSQEAIKKKNENKIDITILPGEEVSIGKGDTNLSKGNGHMLSINANCSIDKLRDDEEIYKCELEEIVNKIKGKIPKDIEPYHYARNLWTIKKIQENNGLAILCHPHWIYYDDKYHLHQPIYKELLKNSKVDAVEVFGDIDQIEECNNLSYLNYYQYKQKHIAAIGNSDAHDIKVGIGDRFSIVFSKTKNEAHITEAIKQLLSVAILKRSKDEYQAIGDEKLVSYTLFLLKEFYPTHDKFKSKEARLIVDGLINKEDFSHKIDIVKSKLLRFKKNFFYKG
ncbi:PHP domain-containing protein [Halarcobacter sp.]|uniref:PHP domain-containing protein n=1 Tax=Halarcobacter sp. TaxID=2321133 RepID=UPI002AA86A1D|nr:PHP domain-containing protein [Halarcobacter sp.]